MHWWYARRTREVHHTRQRLAWSPPGVHPKVMDVAQKAIHNALVVHQAYTRGTPCKTKVGMVTAWHTPEGVAIAQRAVHNALVVRQAYTRGTPCKGWHGHRLAYTQRCGHSSKGCS